MNCDFEGGTTCLWAVRTDGNGTLSIRNGSSPTIYGPKSDHTLRAPGGMTLILIVIYVFVCVFACMY